MSKLRNSTHAASAPLTLMLSVQGATGVSAVIRWHIGDTDTVTPDPSSGGDRNHCCPGALADGLGPLQPPPLVLLGRSRPHQGRRAPGLQRHVQRHAGQRLVSIMIIFYSVINRAANGTSQNFTLSGEDFPVWISKILKTGYGLRGQASQFHVYLSTMFKHPFSTVSLINSL